MLWLAASRTKIDDERSVDLEDLHRETLQVAQ
jgi:hypothetical protein